MFSTTFRYTSRKTLSFVKLACLGALAIFVLASAASLAVNVLVDQQGMMVGCPYMEHGEAMCPMTIADHMNTWRQMFGTVEMSSFTVSISALLLIAATAVAAAVRVSRAGTESGVRLTLYQRNHPELSLYIPLRIVFARGILNPRIFSPAA